MQKIYLFIILIMLAGCSDTYKDPKTKTFYKHCQNMGGHIVEKDDVECQIPGFKYSIVLTDDSPGRIFK